MPPAFVLSQDQTLKFVSRYARHGASPANRDTELQEPIPALVKRNGYEGHVLGNDLINPYTEPEAPRTGRRRPHVPSSKPTMSKSHQASGPEMAAEATKSGGQPSFPAFYFGGPVVRLCWRPGRWTV